MSKLDLNLKSLFSDLEKKYNLPQNFLEAVAHTESNFNPNAVSPVGARGMFQFMPATAKQYNVDVSDPVSSAQGAAKMYADLYKQTGSWDDAAAAYNWGIGNLKKKGMDKAPEETRNYITKINKYLGNNTEKKNLSENNMAVNTPEENAAVAQYLEMEKAAMASGANSAAAEQFQSILAGASKSRKPIQRKEERQNTPEENAAVAEYLAMQQKESQIAQPVTNPMNPASMNVALDNQTTPAGNQQNNLAVQSASVMPSNFDDLGKSVFDKLYTMQQSPEKVMSLWNSLNNSQRSALSSHVKKVQSQHPELQTNVLQDVISGLGRFGSSVNTGFNQIGNLITGDTQGLQKNAEQLKQENQRQEFEDAMNPSATRTVAKYGGELGSFLASPVRLFTKKIADTAAKGAVQVAATTPVENAQSAGDVLAGKAMQAATGAVLAPVAEKAVNLVGGKVAKYMPGTKLTAEDEAFIKAAEAQGIKPLASELPSAKNNPNLQKMGQDLAGKNETVTQRVTDNQNAAEQAAKNLSNEIKTFDKDNYLDKIGLKDDGKNVYSEAIKNLREKVSQVKTDNPDEIFKVAAEANYLNNKIKSSQLYDEATRLAPKDKVVSITEAKQVLDTAKEELKSISSPELKDRFRKVVNNLDASLSKESLDYAKIDSVYKEFGQLARDARKAGDDNSARIYNQAKAALRKDQNDFVGSLPDDVNLQSYKEAYTKATSFNKDNIQTIKKDKVLRNLMEPFTKGGLPNLPDNLISNLVKKGQKEKVQQIFDSLDEDAKSAVQQGVLNKLLSNAQTKDGFSPKAFNKAFNDYTNTTNGNTPLDVVFNAEIKNKLKSLMNIFDNLNTVGYNRANPQTGMKNLTSLDNITKIAAIGSAPFTNGLSLVIPGVNALKNVANVKMLTDKKFNKYLLDVQNTNPKASAYVDKVGKLLGLLTANLGVN